MTGAAGASAGATVSAAGTSGAAGPVNVFGAGCGAAAGMGAAAGVPWAGYFAAQPFSNRWYASRRGDFGSERPFS
ncbi:hypothetical protein ACIOMQ_39145 [Streptomyces sp. NPDC087845]|uniref:hypothetical protein n=1 Tax=Streptomyces sp. NPDC087845 TaxID=3365806 RepID=UPI003815F40E